MILKQEDGTAATAFVSSRGRRWGAVVVEGPQHSTQRGCYIPLRQSFQHARTRSSTPFAFLE